MELSQKLQNLIETTKFQLTKNEINNGAHLKQVTLIFFAASFFVFTAVAVSAVSALRRNLVTFFYVFTLVKKTVNSLLKTT